MPQQFIQPSSHKRLHQCRASSLARADRRACASQGQPEATGAARSYSATAACQIASADRHVAERVWRAGPVRSGLLCLPRHPLCAPKLAASCKCCAPMRTCQRHRRRERDRSDESTASNLPVVVRGAYVCSGGIARRPLAYLVEDSVCLGASSSNSIRLSDNRAYLRRRSTVPKLLPTSH
jgi:hypothetical protein